jgi:3-dehydro-L-gulonate 2-dehydrogenase
MDMALSQFSFGKIQQYRLEGKELPYPGGFDDKGDLSLDADTILRNERGLPIGYWKGSALSIMLDMLASLLSQGNNVFRIGMEKYETGLSQVFLCWDLNRFGDQAFQKQTIREILDYVHGVNPLKPGMNTYYPGEKTMQRRSHHLKNGIEINDQVWDKIMLLKGKID